MISLLVGTEDHVGKQKWGTVAGRRLKKTWDLFPKTLPLSIFTVVVKVKLNAKMSRAFVESYMREPGKGYHNFSRTK